jgi:hypothetical protein
VKLYPQGKKIMKTKIKDFGDGDTFKAIVNLI